MATFSGVIVSRGWQRGPLAVWCFVCDHSLPSLGGTIIVTYLHSTVHPPPPNQIEHVPVCVERLRIETPRWHVLTALWLTSTGAALGVCVCHSSSMSLWHLRLAKLEMSNVEQLQLNEQANWSKFTTRFCLRMYLIETSLWRNGIVLFNCPFISLIISH